MKKSLLAFFVVIVIISVPAARAQSPEYFQCAESLNVMGLFRGSDKGFELERVPSRAEAAVMLVRLLGLESTALSGDLSHPYTDVPDWVAPYVAYLYRNDIVKGISESQFGSDMDCNLMMYVTLVLRALGYSDSKDGDFTYENAVSFGRKTGVLDSFIAEQRFTRGEMAAVSYLALSVKPKRGGYDTLLDKLISEGAVGTECAAPFVDKIRNCAAVTRALSALSESNEYSYIYAKTAYFNSSFTSSRSSTSIRMDYAYRDGALLCAVVEKSGEESLAQYYKDGWYFMNLDGQKYRTRMSLEDALDSFGLAYDDSDLTRIITGATKRIEGKNTVYTVTTSEEEAYQIAEGVLGENPYDTYRDLVIGEAVMSFTIGSDGRLIRQGVDISFSFSARIEGKYYTVYCEDVSTIDIVATGDAVKVEFPADLYGYNIIT